MFGCQPTNLYQYGFAKSEMVGAIDFLFFSFFFLSLFFLTKSIKLNFLAKVKAENQRVDLNPKMSDIIFVRDLYQHTYLYQHIYYASINIQT